MGRNITVIYRWGADYIIVTIDKRKSKSWWWWWGSGNLTTKWPYSLIDAFKYWLICIHNANTLLDLFIHSLAQSSSHLLLSLIDGKIIFCLFFPSLVFFSFIKLIILNCRYLAIWHTHLHLDIHTHPQTAATYFYLHLNPLFASGSSRFGYFWASTGAFWIFCHHFLQRRNLVFRCVLIIINIFPSFSNYLMAEFIFVVVWIYFWNPKTNII